MELSNNTQSISRPVLSVAQLLRQSIRSCLSRTYFDGTGLQEDELREALAKHAECWTDDSVDPSIAATEVCRRVTMGSEATSVDRIGAVHSRLEQYFETLVLNSFSVTRWVLRKEVLQSSLLKRWWLG